MTWRAGVALLALACTPLAAADERCAAAKALFADLAARGLVQGAFVIDLGRGAPCEGAHGHADVERAIPFTPRTPSDGGSIAKTMTAAAVLKLAAQGRLDLEAPVRKYVAGYPHEATRVRHLLAHAAGLPDYDSFDRRFGAGKLRTNAMQLEAIAREGLPPAFAPGSAFSYDNAAYDAAALAIESVAGMPYARYLEREFFQPLGMRDAFIRPALLADFTQPRTRGYRRRASGLDLHDAIEGEAFHGGGNAYVSAADLQRWAAAFARGDKAVEAARDHAKRRARLDDGRTTGLSLSSWYSDAAATRHYYTGHHQGFYAVAYWDAESKGSFGFAVNQLLPSWLEGAITRGLVAVLEGRPVPAMHAPAPVAAPAGASRWRVGGVGEVAIAPGGGPLLRVTVAPGVEYTAFPVGKDSWYVPGLDARLHWEASGRLAWNTVFIQAHGEPIAARS